MGSAYLCMFGTSLLCAQPIEAGMASHQAGLMRMCATRGRHGSNAEPKVEFLHTHVADSEYLNPTRTATHRIIQI